MKTIKNGLVALAFAFGGCSENNSKTLSLSELAESNDPINFERATVYVKVNTPNDWKCEVQADVLLSSSGYEIQTDPLCNWIKFEHRPYKNRDTLSSGAFGEVVYTDLEMDGSVDSVTMDGINMEMRYLTDEVQNKINQRYNETITDLKKEDVEAIWRDRWRR